MQKKNRCFRSRLIFKRIFILGLLPVYAVNIPDQICIDHRKIGNGLKIDVPVDVNIFKIRKNIHQVEYRSFLVKKFGFTMKL
jgi:hypothetical protein